MASVTREETKGEDDEIRSHMFPRDSTGGERGGAKEYIRKEIYVGCVRCEQRDADIAAS